MAAAAARPFATASWRTVVSGGSVRRASGLSSKPTTVRSAGTSSPARARGTQRAGGQRVGEAQQRGRPVRPGEQLADRVEGIVLGADRAVHHDRLDPGRAPARRASRACAAPGGCPRPWSGPRPRPPPRPTRRWPRSTTCWAAAAGPGPVLDVDAGHGRVDRLVDLDQRQPALAQPAEPVGVEPAGVDDGRVHGHVPGGHDRPRAVGRQDGQRQPVARRAPRRSTPGTPRRNRR